MSKIKNKNIFINIVISFWLRLMPFKYPFSVKIELTLKCFIFLLSQLSLFLYLLFIYKLIIFYFILIVSGLKLKPFSFVLSHFFFILFAGCLCYIIVPGAVLFPHLGVFGTWDNKEYLLYSNHIGVCWVMKESKKKRQHKRERLHGWRWGGG